MSLSINKQAYEKLIQQDLEYLNKNCKDGSPELDHIKIVLCNSIDVYYPAENNFDEYYKAMTQHNSNSHE